MQRLILSLVCLVIFNSNLVAHDTFLKFETHFLKPKASVRLSLMNGTISKSENNVAIERMRDVRIVGPKENVQRPSNDQWHLTDTLSQLEFETGAAGTFVAGVSIKPRNIEMTKEKFDRYLKHSGVLDILEQRKRNPTANKKIVEKYSKHVKALFQIGEERTVSYRQEFGYPIEIIPQQNPYSLKAGDKLPVKVCFNGKPVPNQLVYASYVGFHEHDDDGQHVEAVKTRTDDKGIAQIRLTTKGVWYVRLIHMVASEEEGIDYESNWATITFEVK